LWNPVPVSSRLPSSSYLPLFLLRRVYIIKALICTPVSASLPSFFLLPPSFLLPSSFPLLPPQKNGKPGALSISTAREYTPSKLSSGLSHPPSHPSSSLLPSSCSLLPPSFLLLPPPSFLLLIPQKNGKPGALSISTAREYTSKLSSGLLSQPPSRPSSCSLLLLPSFCSLLLPPPYPTEWKAWGLVDLNCKRVYAIKALVWTPVSASLGYVPLPLYGKVDEVKENRPAQEKATLPGK
jgi:hypothetical protein